MNITTAISATIERQAFPLQESCKRKRTRCEAHLPFQEGEQQSRKKIECDPATLVQEKHEKQILEKAVLRIQRLFFYRHKQKNPPEDPLYEKPLKVCRLRKEEEFEHVLKILRAWKSKELPYNFYTSTLCRFENRVIEASKNIIDYIDELLEFKILGLLRRFDLRAPIFFIGVYDAEDRLQGLAAYQRSADEALNLLGLVTAPHNLPLDHHQKSAKRVRGAGTALIEEVLFSRHNLLSGKVAALCVPHPLKVAQKFYEQLGFEPSDPTESPKQGMAPALIFPSSKIGLFLRTFGGRAKPIHSPPIQRPASPSDSLESEELFPQ